jgi:hypothetical protein
MNRFTKIVAAALLGLAIANAHAEILPGSQAYDVEKLVATTEKYSGLSSHGKRPAIFIVTTVEEWANIVGLKVEDAPKVLGYYQSYDRTIFIPLAVARSRMGAGVVLHEVVHFLQEENGIITPTSGIGACNRARIEKQAHGAEAAYLRDDVGNWSERLSIIEQIIDKYAERCAKEGV